MSKSFDVKSTRYEFLLLITAAIWGSAFVAQRLGMNDLGPFSYNAARFFVGTLTLVPVMLMRKTSIAALKKALLPGMLAGTVLAVASGFQQTGLIYTSAGKAGFITGLYVVLVPIAAIALGKKSPLEAWIGALFAFVGLYLLSFTSIDGINTGDMLVFVSAFFWTTHILVLDRWASKVDPVALAATQFFICAILCTAAALFTESPAPHNFTAALWPILYGGVLSIGVAYTLQAVAQTKAHPTRASIIMALESPFAAITGFLFLHERMGTVEILGCVLMLFGSLVAEWPRKKKSAR